MTKEPAAVSAFRRGPSVPPLIVGSSTFLNRAWTRERKHDLCQTQKKYYNWNERTNLQYTAYLTTMLPFPSLHLTQILVLLSNFSLPALPSKFALRYRI